MYVVVVEKCMCSFVCVLSCLVVGTDGNHVSLPGPHQRCCDNNFYILSYFSPPRHYREFTYLYCYIFNIFKIFMCFSYMGVVFKIITINWPI